MRTSLCVFSAAVIGVQALPSLPTSGGLAVLCGACLLAQVRHRRVLAGALFGLCWALWRGQLGLDARLPQAYDGAALRVSGHLVGLPAVSPLGTHFDLKIDTLSAGTRAVLGPRRLRLSAYGQALTPSAGAHCDLYVRARVPRGTRNPGGFDYERWLFASGIDGLGQVIAHPANRCAPAASVWHIDVARARIAAAIAGALSNPAEAGILRALAVGERAQMTPRQWQVLRDTGTTHMVSISGLHVSMVALLVYWLSRRVVGLLPALARHLPAPRAALLLGFSAALLYALLAGFTVPTQRSVLMLGCLFARRWSGHALMDTDGLLVALACVLLADPVAALTASFWLTFGAMGVLVLVTTVLRRSGPLERWLGVHIWLALALAPLLALVVPSVSWTSPIANAVAVPLVTFGVVPLVLLGIALSPLWPACATLSWQLAAGLWRWVWVGLEWLAEHGPAVVLTRSPSAAVAALVGLGLLLWLLPLGRGRGWFALLLVASPALLPAPHPVTGSVVVNVLDVGQGLAVVVQTHAHVLVFDTGPKTFTGRDAGAEIVLPFLRTIGAPVIDRLIVSHADNDHAGGLPALLQALPVGVLTLSPPHRWPVPVERCRAGQHWEWEGVVFSVLHPDSALAMRQSENNASCVLQIAAGERRVLLTGDIEAPAERLLLQGPYALTAAVVIVPHHGSKTSSSPAFVAAVRPDFAVFSVGHLNRFGMPSAQVMARYRAAGAVILDTRRDGALRLAVGPAGLEVTRWRRVAHRYWHLE
ncbi:MAG: DNA internalization-related competence protein ComEC/Rec2 [Gammaproteobacteria bacterium]|nr:DNA internalization-related competence protein ComEC/Rec2 [Gammaproteobacteria bacterium]